MIGMVIVTHGRLAVELINALEHVVGDQFMAKFLNQGTDALKVGAASVE